MGCNSSRFELPSKHHKKQDKPRFHINPQTIDDYTPQGLEVWQAARSLPRASSLLAYRVERGPMRRSHSRRRVRRRPRVHYSREKVGRNDEKMINPKLKERLRERRKSDGSALEDFRADAPLRSAYLPQAMQHNPIGSDLPGRVSAVSTPLLFYPPQQYEYDFRQRMVISRCAPQFEGGAIYQPVGRMRSQNEIRRAPQALINMNYWGPRGSMYKCAQPNWSGHASSVHSPGLISRATTRSIGLVVMGRKPLDYDSPHQDDTLSKHYDPPKVSTGQQSDPFKIHNKRKMCSHPMEDFGKRVSNSYEAGNSRCSYFTEPMCQSHRAFQEPTSQQEQRVHQSLSDFSGVENFGHLSNSETKRSKLGDFSKSDFFDFDGLDKQTSNTLLSKPNAIVMSILLAEADTEDSSSSSSELLGTLNIGEKATADELEKQENILKGFQLT